MTNYKQALDYATSKHAGQIRRFSGEPYIRHPERVVEILRSYGVTDDDTLQSAIMHDCLEDTDATVEEMRTILGDNMKVVRGVLYLTDPCLSIIVEGETKTEKLDRYGLRMAGAPSDIQSIKLADNLDNVPSMVQYAKPEKALNYVEEKLYFLRYLGKANIAMFLDVKEMLLKHQKELREILYGKHEGE